MSRTKGAFPLLRRLPAWIMISAVLLTACNDTGTHREETLPGVPGLSERAQQRLKLRRAFFSGDFAALDQAIDADHERMVAGATGLRARHADW